MLAKKLIQVLYMCNILFKGPQLVDGLDWSGLRSAKKIIQFLPFVDSIVIVVNGQH